MLLHRLRPALPLLTRSSRPPTSLRAHLLARPCPRLRVIPSPALRAPPTRSLRGPAHPFRVHASTCSTQYPPGPPHSRRRRSSGESPARRGVPVEEGERRVSVLATELDDTKIRLDAVPGRHSSTTREREEFLNELVHRSGHRAYRLLHRPGSSQCPFSRRPWMPAVCRRYGGGMAAVWRRYGGGMAAVCRRLVRGDARIIDAEYRKMGENSAFQRPRSGVSVGFWMARLVIHTPAGVPIASAEVPADEVIEVLESWILTLAPTQQSCWTASHLPRVTSSAYYRRRKHRHNRQYNRHIRSKRRRPSTMHSPFTMISTLFVRASGNCCITSSNGRAKWPTRHCGVLVKLPMRPAHSAAPMSARLRCGRPAHPRGALDPHGGALPGARWAGGSDEDRVAMIPFTPTWKVATIDGLLGLLAVAA